MKENREKTDHIARLDAVAKDEQQKRTIVEQKLEQKSQEGVRVFNTLI